MFFGWGNKNKSWAVDDTHHLIARWGYFHILFFPIASKVTWHLVGDSRSEDKVISYEEVKRLVPINTPNINIWHRYGLLMGIAAFILLVIFV